jgi:hypothetical protein
MKLTFTMCILLVLVGLIASPVLMAQNKTVQKSMAVKQYDHVKAQLWQNISAARKNGDIQRYNALMAQMESLEGVGKSDQSAKGNAYPPSLLDASTAPGASLWGNDVLVYGGNISWTGQFNTATASDTLGNIYAACSFPPTASANGGILVYRSSDFGVTWGQVPSGGIIFPRPYAIQSFDLAVTDTANGRWMIGLILVLLDSVYAPNNCGNLYSCNFLDDGSGWRYRLMLTGDGNTKYRSPALTVDGFFYTPATTWFYGAAERVTPSTGVSRGIVAMSTRNNGTTWQNFDTTVSGSSDYDDRNPRISFMHSAVYDSLYIAVAETYAPGDRDAYAYVNKYDVSTAWDYHTISASADDEYDPDIAISTLSESMIATYARKASTGSVNALYARTTDGFRTRQTDTISADASMDEYFITANVVADHGSDEWRVAYKWGTDTVMYKAMVGTPRFLLTSPTVINQFLPTNYLRPRIGAHAQGNGYWGGHVVYVGSGPSNMYFDGPDISVGVKREQNPVPVDYSLAQNYPNPFNPSTTIAFSVPVQSLVTLKVYNIIGQEVASLVNGPMAAGSYSVTFDARSLSSGTYFYRISSGSFVQTRKMVLLK